MKKIIPGCLIFVIVISISTGCKRQGLQTENFHNTQTITTHKEIYELRAGDKVKIAGVFHTTKGCMGVVKDILIPYFTNRKKEASNYEDKWVEVIGKLSKPFYPEDYIGQRRGGFELQLESIKIIRDDIKEEKIELLTE